MPRSRVGRCVPKISKSVLVSRSACVGHAGIAKLDDANDAGTKHSQDCTLILTEGDSAKTMAVSGLSVVGRDRYGVFPLRHAPVRESGAEYFLIQRTLTTERRLVLIHCLA